MSRGLGRGMMRRIKYGAPMVSFESKKMADYRRGYTAAKRRLKGRTRVGGYYGRYTGSNPELKFFDTAIGMSNITNVYAEATNLIPCLNIIPQSDTQSGRDGRRIWVKSIHIRLRIIGNPAAVEPLQFMRVVLYLDRQCNGASVTAAQILQQVSINGFRNIENTQRIQILYDRVHNITPVGVNLASTTQIPGTKHVKWNKKCNIPIDYDSTVTTGVLTSVRANNLGILYYPESSTDTMDILGFCRLRFDEK